VREQLAGDVGVQLGERLAEQPRRAVLAQRAHEGGGERGRQRLPRAPLALPRTARGGCGRGGRGRGGRGAHYDAHALARDAAAELVGAAELQQQRQQQLL